jgi:hypothetical protein
MASCVQCGSAVPEGQRCCSMCYGDPYYGKDGYYLAYLEEQDRQHQEQQQEIEQEHVE